ncbi:hypothetical protein RBG61_11185 [Paludicola sp. MB14-C6]|uniref:hypothetical protein n=1 Tax=Paludihabitans sp. MB14-C6 TaxID=3070656 RepID=UPI0027DD6488|nr:hypothetical protein [Paludicola sp. MB14-C6]WMJ22548.1 hypothetical protein RBG61_11185 [Paludicola sp. MB14-C6]
MIKQIWSIRSNAKLFNGLNFVITLFSLLYTILILFVLPNQIMLFHSQLHSKLILLILPLCSTILCCIFYHIVNKLKKKLADTKKIDRTATQPIRVLHDSVIGFNFLLMVTLFFIQIELLNRAKQIQGFSPLIIYIGLILIILFLIDSIRKYIKSK